MRQVSDDLLPATAQRSPRLTVLLSDWAHSRWTRLHPGGLMADRVLQEAGRVMGIAFSLRWKIINTKLSSVIQVCVQKHEVTILDY